MIEFTHHRLLQPPEFWGEDDRDFFGELDELESGDSVTLEDLSSSGRAQSLPSDSGADLGGD